MEKKYHYRIREVAKLIGVAISTLRFWEDCFSQLKPSRTINGQRRYSEDDVHIISRIKFLVHDQGFPIELAKSELNKKYRKTKSRGTYCCKSVKDAVDLLLVAKNFCEDSHAIQRINAVVDFLQIEFSEFFVKQNKKEWLFSQTVTPIITKLKSNLYCIPIKKNLLWINCIIMQNKTFIFFILNSTLRVLFFLFFAHISLYYI